MLTLVQQARLHPRSLTSPLSHPLRPFTMHNLRHTFGPAEARPEHHFRATQVRRVRLDVHQCRRGRTQYRDAPAIRLQDSFQVGFPTIARSHSTDITAAVPTQIPPHIHPLSPSSSAIHPQPPSALTAPYSLPTSPIPATSSSYPPTSHTGALASDTRTTSPHPVLPQRYALAIACHHRHQYMKVSRRLTCSVWKPLSRAATRSF